MKTAPLVAIVLLTSSGAAKAAELDTLAEQVARLRGEIDALDARLGEQKEDRRAQLRALASQKSAVEMELQREELRAKQLADRVARMTDKKESSGRRQELLSSTVVEAIDRLRRTLEGTIPFQLKERTETLEAIKKDLLAEATAPSVAIARVWEWVDAELKLTRETELGRMVIVLDGKEVLADIARLGTVAMYFRADDKYGLAKKSGGAWSWEPTPAPEDRERIAALFTALEQDAGRGLFTLPGAMNVEMLGVAR